MLVRQPAMLGLVSMPELVRNGTLSAEMAAALWAAVDQGLSFAVLAAHSLAGKTTLMDAVLALRPLDTTLYRLSGDEDDLLALKKRGATGGYLVVEEFGLAPMPTYLWGEPVRRVFGTLKAGYSLAVTLHGEGLGEAFEAICWGNGVRDEDASHLKLVLCLRRFGYSPRTFWRRLVQVHEVDRVQDGRPQGRLLYRWVAEAARFERVEASRQLKAGASDLAARAAMLEELAKSGRTSQADVARMLAAYRARR